MDEPVDPLAALRGKSWDELEAIEQADGRLLFPDAIRRRSKDGKLVEEPVRLRLLRKDERRKARGEARKWAKEDGLDPDQEPALFEEMDNLCILARAIRSPTEPHEQHMLYQQLEKSYDGRSLQEVWDRYQIYEDMADPRTGVVDDKTFWAGVGAIAKAGNILPLAALGSLEQNEFIARMAREALLSPTLQSFVGQFESSTPEP